MAEKDIPGTDFPADINDWTPAQRSQVGAALGVYGDPNITKGLEVLGRDPQPNSAKDLAQDQKSNAEEPMPGTSSNGPTPESAYEQLANAQADQYLAMTKSIDPLTSGYSIPTIDKNISSGAEAMLGQSSSSPISQWLNQQTAAAQSQYAPTEAANSQVAQAENSGEALEAKGLQGLGQAETALMNTAPYDQLLNSLASEVPYHLAEGYSIPGLTKANTPEWLQQAEENVGVTPLAASKGSNSSAQGLLPAPSTGTITPPSITSTETGGAPQG